jgi:protease YdgD
MTGSAAPRAHAAVFGKDERTPVPAQYAQARKAIGLLYNDKAKTVCTAFCVAPQVIATAAHCLFRTSGDKAPGLSDFVFASSRDVYRDGVRLAGHASQAAAQNVIAGSTQIKVRPPIDAASDWALVRLASPACKAMSLTVRGQKLEDVTKAADERRLFQLSFHRDYADWQLAYSRPCTAAKTFGDVSWNTIARDFSSPQSLILHRCATGGASSGSPILLDEPGGPVVVGINVGTYVLSKVLVKDGKIAKRFKQDIIANTAVNATAFADLIAPLREARILEDRDSIRRLQTRLKDLHHYTGALDGSYGPLMKAAIEDFQRTHGQPVTGLATVELFDLIMREGPAAEPKPVGTVGLSKPTVHVGGEQGK